VQIDRDAQDRVLDEMQGVFVVTTEDGVAHRLDLNQRQVIRTAQVGPGIHIAVDSAPAALVAVATCRVGAPMVLLIDRGAPGVWFTRRSSANVLVIDQVPPLPPHSARHVVP
jgi:hypothetical protein